MAAGLHMASIYVEHPYMNSKEHLINLNRRTCNKTNVFISWNGSFI